MIPASYIHDQANLSTDESVDNNRLDDSSQLTKTLTSNRLQNTKKKNGISETHNKSPRRDPVRRAKLLKAKKKAKPEMISIPASYVVDKSLTVSEREMMFPKSNSCSSMFERTVSERRYPQRWAARSQRSSSERSLSSRSSQRSLCSLPPPPGIAKGGVWGEIFYNGKFTVGMTLLCILVVGPFGFLAAGQPQDLKTVYKLGSTLYSKKGKALDPTQYPSNFHPLKKGRGLRRSDSMLT